MRKIEEFLILMKFYFLRILQSINLIKIYIFLNIINYQLKYLKIQNLKCLVKKPKKKELLLKNPSLLTLNPLVGMKKS